MEGWQERVIQEKGELGIKIDKLEIFMRSSAFAKLDDYAQKLLIRQNDAMYSYFSILKVRVEGF